MVHSVQGGPLPHDGGHAAQLQHVPGTARLGQPCLHGLHPALASILGLFLQFLPLGTIVKKNCVFFPFFNNAFLFYLLFLVFTFPTS